jgi:hypothetical protein
LSHWISEFIWDLEFKIGDFHFPFFDSVMEDWVHLDGCAHGAVELEGQNSLAYRPEILFSGAALSRPDHP